MKEKLICAECGYGIASTETRVHHGEEANSHLICHYEGLKNEIKHTYNLLEECQKEELNMRTQIGYNKGIILKLKAELKSLMRKHKTELILNEI